MTKYSCPISKAAADGETVENTNKGDTWYFDVGIWKVDPNSSGPILDIGAWQVIP